MASIVSENPSKVTSLIQATFPSPWWVKYGPAMAVLFTSSCAAIVTMRLLRDVFFYRSAFLEYAVWPLTMILPVRSLYQLAREGIPWVWGNMPPAPANTGELWYSVVGDRLWFVNLVWFLAFLVCEVINSRSRIQELTDKEFRLTTWPSFPVCIGSPFIGLLVSRYLLTWLGIQGLMPFLFLTVVVAIPVCYLETKWVNRSFVSK